MDPTLATTLAQFGVAGLIGWMWLTERRATEARDKQLAEAHAHITQDRTTITTLLKALEDNTRAITTLESTQRRLLESMNQRSSPLSPSGGDVAVLRDREGGLGGGMFIGGAHRDERGGDGGQHPPAHSCTRRGHYEPRTK